MNTNIKVTQTINVKIKDVDYTLTSVEATALYNALGAALNLHQPFDNPTYPKHPWPNFPYNPYDIWYGIPPVTTTKAKPINFCGDNNVTSYTSDNWNKAMDIGYNLDKKS